MSKETTDIKIEKLGMEAKPYDKVLTKVAELCPAAVQNGKVDFERLKAELADVVDENARETYEFKWVGKNAAMVEANKPIRKTLRPCKEESKNWDATENLYIEGDNLEVLKLLEEGYLGKIKMIYIDPPYNTGNDFVYHDNRVQSEEEMNQGIDLFDEEDNRLLSKSFVRNTESSGRFHSDWCSMMYPRLKLARDLLTDDGAAFIHIDEHEVDNLTKILKEIFGEDNELGTIIWDKRNPKGSVVGIAYQHESILCFAKNILCFASNNFSKKKEHADSMLKKVDDLLKKYGAVNDVVKNEYKKWLKEKTDLSGGEKAYQLIDKDGNIYQQVSMAAPDKPETRSHRPLLHPITNLPCPVPDKGWRYTDDTMDSLLKEDKIDFGKDETTQPRQKYLLKENLREAVASILYYGGADDAMGLPFDNHKPVIVSKKLIETLVKDNDIILDFFSGSATTAHAVMQLNAEDGGNRKFIMVQLPEETDEKSEAYKAGYKNICEIGKERIRRAGDKIVQETGKTDLDIGFRVLKVDDSNMQDVYYKPSELKQADLLSSIDNIKADRTPLDLLFGVIVEWGVSLSLPLQEVKVGENTIHIVGDNDLVACFDRNVSTATITKMAELNPTRVVFRDSCFEKDDEKINMFEIFKTICHWDDKQAKDNVRVM